MDTPTLSIKEAADRYQKAEITIRRLVRTIVKDAESPDRHLITPDPVEAKKLQAKRKPFSYSLNPELLEKHFSQAAAQRPVKSATQNGEYVRLLQKTAEGLQEQLKVKDDQIKALQNSIDGLSERQREMNILMKGLQQQLMLTSGQPAEHASWWAFWKRK
jgi:peptidoglycan hydrolase CwlO-like protein